MIIQFATSIASHLVWELLFVFIEMRFYAEFVLGGFPDANELLRFSIGGLGYREAGLPSAWRGDAPAGTWEPGISEVLRNKSLISSFHSPVDKIIVTTAYCNVPFTVP